MASQNCTAPQAAARYLPSREKASPLTAAASFAAFVHRCAPVATSQTVTVPSSPPAATYRLSSEIATELTSFGAFRVKSETGGLPGLPCFVVGAGTSQVLTSCPPAT